MMMLEQVDIYQWYVITEYRLSVKASVYKCYWIMTVKYLGHHCLFYHMLFGFLHIGENLVKKPLNN